MDDATQRLAVIVGQLTGVVTEIAVILDRNSGWLSTREELSNLRSELRDLQAKLSDLHSD